MLTPQFLNEHTRLSIKNPGNTKEIIDFNTLDFINSKYNKVSLGTSEYKNIELRIKRPESAPTEKYTKNMNTKNLEEITDNKDENDLEKNDHLEITDGLNIEENLDLNNKVPDVVIHNNADENNDDEDDIKVIDKKKDEDDDIETEMIKTMKEKTQMKEKIQMKMQIPKKKIKKTMKIKQKRRKWMRT
eukprot:GAHX01002348.1.p1 GENE.GAHX01002348.1~~GAHX01002348.1.p1  ORF type:complete len:188 (+),score=59.82 GAHX01002348.1:1378-1941(+)